MVTDVSIFIYHNTTKVKIYFYFFFFSMSFSSEAKESLAIDNFNGASGFNHSPVTPNTKFGHL